MKNPIFQSSMAPSFRALVQLRRSLGYADRGLISHLVQFDRYLLARGSRSRILSRRLVEGWLSSKGPLAPSTQSGCLHSLRVLGRFLAQTHPDSYIPGPAWSRRRVPRFRPHIYTPAQICGLLQEAARLTPAGSLRPQTYVTLFSLLYSTGLRISEALALTVADVDLAEGVLCVRESKFRKSRAIPLRSDTVRGLQRYLEARSAFARVHAQAPFFVHQRKGPCSQPLIYRTFLEMARRIGLRGPPGTAGPRIHDIRHTFAVHRLLEWYRDGGDVQARLPLLATYMGHVSLVSTQVYLEVTAELLGEAAKRFCPPRLPLIAQRGSP